MKLKINQECKSDLNLCFPEIRNIDLPQQFFANSPEFFRLPKLLSFPFLKVELSISFGAFRNDNGDNIDEKMMTNEND